MLARTAKVSSVYAGIVKFDEQPDGTVMVYGKATDDSIDSDEQICDPSWLSKAMPDWFQYGNIREQHSNIAAGVATEYKSEGSEHWITAHVVDPTSAAKVKAGVLKGFSIGIRGARVAKDNKATGGRIVDGTIVEVSLVDRPANPSCTLVVAKSVGADLIQVEEYMEAENPAVEAPVEAAEVTEAPEADKSASAAIAKARAIGGDLTKFDAAGFDMARRGLAMLVAREAAEMAEGADESDSLAALLLAVHALFEFHEHEAAEGEVEPLPESEGDIDIDNEASIELSDAADEPKMCKVCGKADGECDCTDEEKAAAKAARKAAKQAEKEAAKAAKVSDLRELIAEVVKSVLATSHEAADDVVTKAVESERIEALESELAQVKALAAPSGPKRIAPAVSAEKSSVLIKSAQLRAKARETQDRTLAAGYLQMADELEKSL